MKPSQNSLFKADTCVKTVAASGFLGLVHVNIGTKEKTPQSQNKSTMSWIYWVILIVGLTILFSLILYLWIRWLVKREPYGSFARLRTRRKLTFFRFMLREKRVPLYVKVIPVILLVYLAIPFDIIPDFVPVLGYLDDVALVLLALVLIIKLTPRTVVQELIDKAQAVS